MATAAVHPSGNLIAPLHFYSPPLDGSPPYNLAGDVPPGAIPRNFSSIPHPISITDARPFPHRFTLDEDAFQILLSQPPSSEVSFTSPDSIAANYYPEIESLLLSTVPGADRVIIFDHTLRQSTPSAPREPVQRVHIDQTLSSTIQRIHRHASSPEEAEALLQKRFRIINVWRPLNKSPVETFPLAFASSASLRDEEIIPVEHRYLTTGYTGQTAAIKYHPDQKWYYLSGMTGDERILLECFDSEALKEGTKVKGGRVAHTAFADPRSRKGAEGRESIEVRALVFGP